MTTSIYVGLSSPTGVPIEDLANFQDDPQGPGLEYAYTVGGIGYCTLRRNNQYDLGMFPLDARLGVWRVFNPGAPARLDNDAIHLVRDYLYTPFTNGVTAYHANELFERRISAYDAGTGYTSKTGDADDLIKAYWNQNAGSAFVGADRDGSDTQVDVSSLVSVQANLGLGPSMNDQSTRRRLDRIIQELSQAAATAGTYVVAEIVASGTQKRSLEVRTYINQRGVDRRNLILSEAQGNLENVSVRKSHRNEATMVICGGGGLGSQRAIAVAEDLVRMAASPLNRRELFIEQQDTQDTAVLQDKADAALRAAAPTVVIEGDLVNTTSAARGIHYNIGDLVTVEHPVAGRFVVRLEVLTCRVSGGKVQDRVRFRGVL